MMATSAPKAVSSAAQADAPAKPKARNRKRPIVLGAVAALVVAAAAGAGLYFFQPELFHQGAPAEHKPEPAKPPVFMNLDPFTVNLQIEDGQQQFLQVGMTIQVADQAQADVIKLYLPQVRSRLLLLLTSKKASEILTVEGKKKLSAEIAAQLKQPFSAQGPNANVTDVFFTSFVVQ
jgi:flagellar FliL protein